MADGKHKKLDQLEARTCCNCRSLFTATRASQEFCAERCRKQFHVDHGKAGRATSVRRTLKGASVIIHFRGPAAEAALQVKVGQRVRLVDFEEPKS